MIKILEKTFPLAGHHNRDSGAVYNGRYENKETQKIRDKVIFYLEKLGVSYIKDRDDRTLSQVIKDIKPGSGSVLYDSHLDAAGNETATGTTCVVSNESYAAKDDSYKIGVEICEVVSKILGIRNRGVIPESQTPRKRLAILHTKAGIAVVHEWGFITNKNDMSAIDANLDKAAEAVAKILKKYDDMK